MDFSKVVAEKIAGEKHDLYDIKNKFSSAVLMFAAALLACMVLYHAAPALQVYSGTMAFSPAESNVSSSSVEDFSLENVLSKASMPNNTVILTTLNEAWAAPNSVFDLFLHSFRIGNETIELLNHVVVIAMDEKAYNRCIAIHPHCYYLSSNGTDFSGEKDFMTPDYLKMMWRRIEFLGTVLDLGYSFIFTDTDIMWFRNPFPRFHPDADFQIACDFFKGNSLDISRNLPNGGFAYVKSSNRTSQFYKFWYKSRETYPGLHDQDVLNNIKLDPYINEIGLRIRFLDTAYFGGFCQPSKDLNKVCTMHANCCIGLSNKVHDLNITLGVWQKYLSLDNDTWKPTNRSPWTVPKHC
ncbi:uncharacterized protein At4g15970-like isoform X2 [Daucus carota subsp. sativus]|uniref:uncharacterized protein At4g15970-like isoform X2 n=1 Tax=Daucus carota subsp. sativus TaxID=79200 RepID=UPI0007F044F1|nr:PREDICTED: uncharacterized protein At4g15970-like [Daucus carota subsp. sativus]